MGLDPGPACFNVFVRASCTIRYTANRKPSSSAQTGPEQVNDTGTPAART
ncbi:hypothetical protein [Actinocrispum sp. NPDC049592]